MAKPFKRIGDVVPLIVQEAQSDVVVCGGDPSMLTLTPIVAKKLQRKQAELEQDFGFLPTLEQTVAYLLRDVASADAPEPEPAWHEEARQHMRNGNKIFAIKVVREKSGMGLKEAKDFVEDNWTHLLPHTI